MIKRILIRAYGIWINDNLEVLVSNEYMYQTQMTKFPGGGLQPGEGITDCLKREWKEELNINITIVEHFYTTDFFQESAFDAGDQIIGIYYLVKPIQNIETSIKENSFDYKSIAKEIQKLRFIKINELNDEDLTFPIDRKVANMLKRKFYSSGKSSQR